MIEAGSLTYPRDRLPIHLSNYWWAGISNFLYSTIGDHWNLYISSFFTSVLSLIMRSQPASIAWTGTSTAAYYHCWSYMEHSVLYIFGINIVWSYEICEFIWFLTSTISNLYTCLVLLIQMGYENWYCFISIKFGPAKKWIICRNFVAGVATFLWVY